MKALIQRVRRASVEVEDRTVGAIDHGLLALVGVEKGDDEASADRLLHKLLHYRVFADDQDKMNLNVQQAGGGLLLVSQFTLAADTRKGPARHRRPKAIVCFTTCSTRPASAMGRWPAANSAPICRWR